MIARTAQHLHRLPMWVYLFLVLIALVMGILFVSATASAVGLPLGGKIIAITPHPAAPGDPCFAYTPSSITIAGVYPSPAPCGVMWPAFPTPPIGAWFLGSAIPIGSVLVINVGWIGM